MNNTYTFKKIIFGLRKEYLEIEKQLNELKKYIELSNKLENAIIHLGSGTGELYLHLIKKKNLIEKIQMLLGTYTYKESFPSEEITNGVKKQDHCNKKNIFFVNNQDEFNEKIKQIKQTDFFKNIVANNHISIPCLENDIISLLISAGIIKLFDQNESIFIYFQYLPIRDEFEIKTGEKIITPDDIYKLLNLSIDGNYLNDYHHNILDNYEEKEIDIDDNFSSNYTKIQIIEEPKKLILKPKKNI